MIKKILLSALIFGCATFAQSTPEELASQDVGLEVSSLFFEQSYESLASTLQPTVSDQNDGSVDITLDQDQLPQQKTVDVDSDFGVTVIQNKMQMDVTEGGYDLQNLTIFEQILQPLVDSISEKKSLKTEP